MPKKVLFAALAASVCAMAVVGCTKSGDDAPPPLDSGAPAVGPFSPPALTGDAAPQLPSLNLGPSGGGDAGPDPADAGPDVQPVENDPGPALGIRVWATDSDGRLLSFRVQAPGTVAIRLFSGLAAGEKIINVSYRPATGTMYGLSNASRLYTIDPLTAAATVVGDGMPFTPAIVGQANGFDFNPVADKIRVHTDVDEDLRLDPLTGKVAGTDATLAFAPADVNAGQSPNLVGTGYTNSVTPAPATTMLYALDSTRNLLTRLPNPNDGMIETVGELGVDFDQAAGFDISKLGVAYAALHVGAETALYTVDLTTGVATKLGAIGFPLPFTSIAVEP